MSIHRWVLAPRCHTGLAAVNHKADASLGVSLPDNETVFRRQTCAQAQIEICKCVGKKVLEKCRHYYILKISARLDHCDGNFDSTSLSRDGLNPSCLLLSGQDH
ncbi:uncharacterized protein HMPREF1120_01982 [Exophiala dermatitidis NIH/UT8656]|uniref:Uncharacterized protein n=1 Tax=Exophiala dermatitidis (strain ATCC 34100 / CBS 525.76 / NIH/UT8656) TaxID=858893 RepID=H6BQI2_EXODN|nr:uncharacterized protein HMPREF1120_01982 [Exophiala dermatitidis NIH/UT8656]EHY53799.1 hypothetical protein HMPREF1120_01982 [Exophiala dermatitidis NIH/UT8656]